MAALLALEISLQTSVYETQLIMSMLKLLRGLRQPHHPSPSSPSPQDDQLNTLHSLISSTVDPFCSPVHIHEGLGTSDWPSEKLLIQVAGIIVDCFAFLATALHNF